jgi:uncharacterized membrane protein YqaE (UPF0057 family)
MGYLLAILLPPVGVLYSDSGLDCNNDRLCDKEQLVSLITRRFGYCVPPRGESLALK